MAVNKPQKRKFTRFFVDWKAAVFFGQMPKETAHKAKVCDISLGGLGLLIEKKMVKGDTHKLVVAIPSYDQSGYRYVQGTYKVIDSFLSSDGQFKCGLELKEMDVQSKESLIWFLREESKRLEWVYSRESGNYEFVKEAYA